MFRMSPVRGMVAMLAGLFCLVAVQADEAGGPVHVAVLENSPSRIVVQYDIADYTGETVEIDGGKYSLFRIGRDSLLQIVGEPALPHVCRSVIIPDDADMKLAVVDAAYTDLPNIDVVPSKGDLLRTVDPATVPYTFGDVYQTDAFYPGTLAALREPYILRDHRGVVVELNPFQYNPVTRTLRVYQTVTLELVPAGPATTNVLDRPSKPSRAFEDVYQHHFINYAPPSRYAPLIEDGEMLIICHDAWIPNMQPLVNHKNMRGIDTTIVGVSTIGNNSTAIQSYIQNFYNSHDLAFVLLVGDSAQVATPTASGGSSDPTYSKLAGGDSYPDIMVGRFSAETSAHVDTQVQRTIEYEQMPATAQDWFWRGTGIASNQGPGDDGEYDNQHIDNIRADLLAYGYTTVDQIYDPSATAAQVAAALNAGRGIINYCGHGSIDAWSSSGFSITNVNALTNDNMLPFICSVACVNGQFAGYTCFAEAWLRATHNGEPTGAIGAYMSSINQSWNPPMDAEDEFVDMYVSEAYSCLGTLLYAGSCHMMDQYGSAGVSMFDTWHLFGDPSLRVVVSCTDLGTIALDRGKYACEGTVTIGVVDCGLNLDNAVIDSAQVLVASDTESAGEWVTVTELGPDSGQFEGSIDISPTNAAGVLQVGADDTIVATYNDLDTGNGQPGVATAQAVVDCTPPEILNVEVIDIQPRAATVRITADETIRGQVYFGPACDDLPGDAMGGYGNPAAVAISGLQDNSAYYFKLYVEDEAGNFTTDDNNGECYTFETPDIPNFFTELFASGNDLDNVTLFFTPNGTVDFYAGCAEDITALPTDPAGSTSITMSDDDYEQINLTGGQTVQLYGQSYSAVFIGSNGYVTFGAGDTDYSETLEDHFDLPRVSAVFDDLYPPSGGTISYKQLADRFVVNWINVPEITSLVLNTFQIELYFNGDIRVSYLTVNVSDGLAGLSRGNGVDPDFYMSDLSGLGSCGPRPPSAFNGSATGPAHQDLTITLHAEDDGLPEPARLDYLIDTLPAHGTLFDPATLDAIDAVPYTLLDEGNQVIYQPTGWYMGGDSFRFLANDGGAAPEGGDSNVATVSITITEPEPEPQILFPLDSDPGWTREGLWQFGAPVAGGTHNYDPGYAHTGGNVFGYRIGGDYTNNMPVRALTTTAIDCGDLLLTELHFWYWLGVERSPYDNATVEISANGTDWTVLWANPAVTVADHEWSEMVFDVSAIADGQPTVYVRWTMGPTDGGTTYPGWSLDDVAIWGVNTAEACPGDLDGDNDVDLTDLARLLANYGITGGAAYEDGDLDGDGDVDLTDLAALLAVYGTSCQPCLNFQSPSGSERAFSEPERQRAGN